MDQGTLTLRSTVFMYSVCKETFLLKKIQPLSQSDKLKAKMKLFFIYFCIMGNPKKNCCKENFAI